MGNIISFLYRSFCGEFQACGGDTIYASIFWGDWKHDHLCMKNFLEEHGFRMESKTITEEDGSDAYSAEYVFQKAS